MRRLRVEEGWAVATAIMLVAVMLIAGLGLLAVVDVQSGQSSVERRSESAFTLAEGVLGSQAFALSRAWPETAAQSVCTQATADDPDDGCPDPSDVVERFGGSEYSGATWQTDIHDNGSLASAYWTPEALSQPAYDANADGKVWVRARATTSGRTRTVVALANVQRPPALPAGFGSLSGGFQTSLAQLGSSVNSALAVSLLDRLIGDHRLVTGKMGIRCGLASELPGSLVGCVSAVPAALNETQLSEVLPSDVVHYGVAAAASDDVAAQLRRRAQSQGTYTETLSSGASCLPAGTSGHGTFFIEKIGDGTGTCTLSSNVSVNILVVANGRVDVTGGNFTGVIYALNRQDDGLSRAVVTVRSGAKVVGGVFVDDMGGLAVYPPPLDIRAACRAALGPLSLTCSVSLTSDIVAALVGNATFVNHLVTQIGASAPAIQYDCRYVTDDATACPSRDEAFLIRSNGTAGTVQSTFREIPSG